MTTKTRKYGAITLSRINFSAYADMRLFRLVECLLVTTACCLVVRLGLGCEEKNSVVIGYAHVFTLLSVATVTWYAAFQWEVQGCRPVIQGPPRTLARSLRCQPSKSPWLRSSNSDCLVQPPVHRFTVDSRAFSVAILRTRLGSFLFTESYSDIRLTWHFVSTH